MEKIDPGQKNIIELTEAQEIIGLKKHFALELEKPEKGSFLKKLKRVGGALALAGITAFSPRLAIAPETTEEYKIARSGEDLGKIALQNDELFKRVSKALEETGGIKVSPQLETVYKVMPEVTKMLAMGKVANGEIPYFSKPEVILGQEFIYEHPKAARAYMDKIKKTIQATVMVLKGDWLVGSGTIIDSGYGVVIITNEHVAKYDEGDFSFVTASGENFKTKKVFSDKNKDLAILESDANFTSALKSKKINALKLASKETQEGLNFRDKLAAVGHPLGFPFEVATAEYAGYQKPIEVVINGVKIKGNTPEMVYQRSDRRFSKLQTYDNKIAREPIEAKKGDILGGMSGGPLIELDKKGEPEIVGITAVRMYGKETNGVLIGGAISANDVRQHLDEYNTYLKAPKPKEDY